MTALYECEVEHVRSAPLRHAFRYRTYQWLVDLDALPRLPRPLRPLARFEARDHLGDPTVSIRANLDRFLTGRGIDLTGGRVLLLTNARVLGYVFNPLSVFWCFDRAGELSAVVAEVHNTYHERHCYLLHPDAQGRVETDKAFYVSPFFPVDGRYSMALPVPGERLRLAITLHRGEGRPFTATVRGRAQPVTAASVLRAALRHPAAPAAVSLRIRRQGIALFLRGLRPAPRPVHQPQQGVQ